MQIEMERNTALTKHIADILASFRVVAGISKWVTIMIGGLLAVWQGLDFWRK